VAEVTLSAIGKVYSDGTRAVDSLDLEIRDGEFMVLVGPSGCGKTTVLRMVAGLEDISEGEITIGGQKVNDVIPQERDVAMVFQNYALYPHMTVAENIGFGLRMRKVAKRERRERVEEIARVLRLTELLDRRPRVLSGGQRQRVAMGRAIIRNPQVLLMDEPLSNLDAKLRVQMRSEIARIQREIRGTTIYVTHDQVEAMTMGHRVAVMRRGVLQQVAVPQQIFEAPANLFVATFIGSPPMNLLRARVEAAEKLELAIGNQRVALGDSDAATRRALARLAGREVCVGIRPEYVRRPVQPGNRNATGTLRGHVFATELLGSDLLVHLRVNASPVVTEELIEVAADVDASTVEELRDKQAENWTTVICRFDAGLPVTLDEPLEIMLPVERLHFFDLATGTAISTDAARSRDSAQLVLAE
jgi:multiple sugar transport system ATP-binding protein